MFDSLMERVLEQYIELLFFSQVNINRFNIISNN